MAQLKVKEWTVVYNFGEHRTSDDRLTYSYRKQGSEGKRILQLEVTEKTDMTKLIRKLFKSTSGIDSHKVYTIREAKEVLCG